MATLGEQLNQGLLAALGQGPTPQGGAPAGGNPLLGQLNGQVASEQRDVLGSQFGQLRDLNTLLSLPDVMARGPYRGASKKESTAINKFLDSYHNYAATPKEAGGLGYSMPQAWALALSMARTAFPQVAPQQILGLGSPQAPAGVRRYGAWISPLRIVQGGEGGKGMSEERVREILELPGFQGMLGFARKLKDDSGGVVDATSLASAFYDRAMSQQFGQTPEGEWKPVTKDTDPNLFVKTRNRSSREARTWMKKNSQYLSLIAALIGAY